MERSLIRVCSPGVLSLLKKQDLFSVQVRVSRLRMADSVSQQCLRVGVLVLVKAYPSSQQNRDLLPLLHKMASVASRQRRPNLCNSLEHNHELMLWVYLRT